MPKMSGYVKTFKVKDGDKDENNKLICCCKDDGKLLEKHKAILLTWKTSKNIKLNALSSTMTDIQKPKLKTYDDKNYTNFDSLNVLEDDVECESFTVIYIGSLLAYDNKYYRQVHLDNSVYNILNK